ncbi:MAG: TonB-dependent receptor [Sphingomonadales bacterium]|nr:TonB-dependent receptor [Sphingomonadales bacterium]
MSACRNEGDVAKPEKRLVRLFGGAAIAAALLVGVAEAGEEEVRYNIAAQGLAEALNQFAVQSNLQLMYPPELVAKLETGGLNGRYSAESALAKLLDGTGIEYEFASNNTLILRRTPPGPQGDSKNHRVEPSRQMAQATAPVLQTDATAIDQIDDRVARQEEEQSDFERIVVTGTRIPGGNPSDSLIVIDRDAIVRGGFNDTESLLRALPQNFANDGPGTAFGTGGNLNGGFGSGVNLRGLGSDSTLTLLNGRRMAAAGGDVGGFVDVGGLPLAAIERVEVLPDGASAIYGSDAVAGVVNFVLRSDYEGAETRLRYGNGSTGSDDFSASQVIGHHWDGGRVLATAEYRYTGTVELAEFGVTSLDLRPLGGDDFRPLAFDPGSGRFDPGRGTVIPVAGPILTDLFAPFAVLPLDQDGTALSLGDVTPVFDPTTLPRQGPVTRDLLPRTEQFSAFLSFEQEVADNVTAFFEGLYARRWNDFRSFRLNDFIVVTPLNPFSPFSEPVAVVYQAIEELGVAMFSADTETFSLNFGLEGRVFGDWNWEVVGAYSKDETNSGIDNEFMKNPLIVSQFVDNPDPAVAFNPFGDGTAQNPETVAALTDFTEIMQTSDLWSVQAKIDGVLFSLPAGEARIAFGGEYREESLDDFIDLGSVQQLLPNPVSFFGPDVQAQRDLWAVFAEALIPIFGDASGTSAMRSLDLSIAARFEEYSDFGSTFNPKIGLAWSPAEGVVVRANWGTSFRAPLLRELFGLSNTQPGFAVFDPNAPGGPALVLANLTEGGNPTLTDEEGESFNVGIEIRPSALPGATFRANYFNTEFKNRIRGGFDGLSFDLLLANEDLLPPGIVIRDAGGNLVAISLANINAAETKIAGLDFSADYVDETDIGTFNASLAGTYFTKFDEVLFPGNEPLELLDTIGNPVDLRLRGSLGWTYDGFNAALFVNYTDSYINNLQDPTGVPQSQKISSYMTVDLQFSYRPGGPRWLDGTVFRIGATNLFNENPPFVNASDRPGLDVEKINARGRVFYVELTKSFASLGL